MADISLETVTGKLNRIGYDAFIQSLRQAKGAGNRHLEFAHWLGHILRVQGSDVALTAEVDRAPSYAERFSDHAPLVVIYDL